MHPTPEEQLVAIERLINRAAEAYGRGAERSGIEADLADAGRLTRRLRRSWARRLPFLERDNELATEVLTSLLPLLPELSARLAAAIGGDDAHDRNKALQALLSEAIRNLPEDLDGDEARARIATYLRARLAANPALHRDPVHR